MPAVMDRPVMDRQAVIWHDTDDDMQPIWVLLVHETANQNWFDIGNILLKVLPELNKDKINDIAQEIKTKHTGTILRDLKPIIERYYERLHRHQLDVTMEQE